jgi:hypothetical protein
MALAIGIDSVACESKYESKSIPFDGRGDFFFCRTSPPKVPGEHPTKMRISGGVP